METYPKARDQEFLNTIAYLDLKENSILLDIPSGGGYLKDYLPYNIKYLSYDFAGEFDDAHSGVMKCKESEIGITDTAVDEAVSLAAHHHIIERVSFYQEIYRVLKPGGKFVIADVIVGSKVDPFLNVFLNQWNSMGHKGVFLDFEKDVKELESVGFKVEVERKKFEWVFDNLNSVTDYFRKLFFLDLDPDESLLISELQKLGIVEKEGRTMIGWELGFLICRK